MSTLFTELSVEKCDTLANGFFGIYIDEKSSQETIVNINLLIPKLWHFVSENVRCEFGIRCATFIANGEEHAKKTSKRFLEITGGLSYLPDPVKVPQIRGVIERLLEAHKGMNNFYNEPSVARELQSIIGDHGNVPDNLNYLYIKTLVCVFLTNGHGMIWSADPIYILS